MDANAREPSNFEIGQESTQPAELTASIGADQRFDDADGGAHREASIRFEGRAGEYFRIWIVNLLLTVVTLGIYSAWAKVRKKRYFYGNTLLEGSSFVYLGDPIAILKGRALIVGVLLLLTLIARWVQFDFTPIVFLIALPFVLVKAMRFNNANSAFRNVRFSFEPGPNGYFKAFKALVLPALAAMLTLGTMYPYFAYKRWCFLVQNSRYGTTYFTTSVTLRSYFGVYFKASLLFVVFLIGSVVTLGIGALPLYILFASYRDAAIARLNWSQTNLGQIQLRCNWKVWSLFKLHLGNSLAVIFTLGLLAPWALIRTTKYQLEGLSVKPADAIDEFTASALSTGSAMGEEAGEFLGMDLGL